jgi:hypothetical protein
MSPSETEKSYHFLLMATSRMGAVGLLLVKSETDRDCFERVGLVFETREWRDDLSNWALRWATEKIEKKEADLRGKAWKNWKGVARKLTIQVV